MRFFFFQKLNNYLRKIYIIQSVRNSVNSCLIILKLPSRSSSIILLFEKFRGAKFLLNEKSKGISSHFPLTFLVYSWKTMVHGRDLVEFTLNEADVCQGQ